MSLDQVVKFIINDSGTASLYLRAIRLFEFQVAVFNPDSFDELIAAKKDHRAPSKLLRTARIFAAIRFLEELEGKLQQNNDGKPISIKQFVENSDYQTIFDDIIIPNGGWLRIRHSPSARSFDNKIDNRRTQAQTAASIVDFSYRYDRAPIDPDRIGGKTSALYVVRTAGSLRPRKMHRTTIKSLWSKFSSTAPFLYLLLMQDFPLMPPRVGSKTFLADLMKQAEDTGTIRHFFRAYQHLSEALKRQGYETDTLQYDLNCGIPELRADPFGPDVVTAFEDPKAKSGS